MLEINNKVALVVCSNGKAKEDKVKLDNLEKTLLDLGLVPIYSNYLYLNNLKLRRIVWLIYIMY